MSGFASVENGKLGGRPPGVKNASTIKKEALRQRFEEYFAKEWDTLVESQMKDAIENFKARHYVFDQILGKPKESLELSGDENKPIAFEITEAIKKIYGG